MRARQPMIVGRVERVRELPVPIGEAVSVDPNELVVMILINAAHLLDEAFTLIRGHFRSSNDCIQCVAVHEGLQRRVGLRLRRRSAPRTGAGRSILTRRRKGDETRKRKCIDSCT